jgi:hypothetical protein
MTTVTNRKMFLLSVLSISFLLPMFFYSLKSFSNPSVTVKVDQQRTIESNLTEVKTLMVGTDKEPIIFSKLQYLNQARNVILFSCLPSFSYY